MLCIFLTVEFPVLHSPLKQLPNRPVFSDSWDYWKYFFEVIIFSLLFSPCIVTSAGFNYFFLYVHHHIQLILPVSNQSKVPIPLVNSSVL